MDHANPDNSTDDIDDLVDWREMYHQLARTYAEATEAWALRQQRERDETTLYFGIEILDTDGWRTTGDAYTEYEHALTFARTLTGWDTRILTWKETRPQVIAIANLESSL